MCTSAQNMYEYNTKLQTLNRYSHLRRVSYFSHCYLLSLPPTLNLHLFATYKRVRGNGGQRLLRGLRNHRCYRAHMSSQWSIVGEIRRDVSLASVVALRLVAILEDAPRRITSCLRECNSAQQHRDPQTSIRDGKDAYREANKEASDLSLSAFGDKE